MQFTRFLLHILRIWIKTAWLLMRFNHTDKSLLFFLFQKTLWFCYGFWFGRWFQHPTVPCIKWQMSHTDQRHREQCSTLERPQCKSITNKYHLKFLWAGLIRIMITNHRALSLYWYKYMSWFFTSFFLKRMFLYNSNLFITY